MKKISLTKLFFTFFKINALTFGGGYTIVPIVKDVFVEELEAISEDDMLDIVALAQGGPGAMAISTSILTGYKVCGPAGAVVALVASTLPCLIILSLVAKFYTEFRENFFISSALMGISGIISAVLFITVLRMGKTAYRKYPLFSSVVMILIFLVGIFTNVDTVYLIIASALSGVIVFGIGGRK